MQPEYLSVNKHSFGVVMSKYYVFTWAKQTDISYELQIYLACIFLLSEVIQIFVIIRSHMNTTKCDQENTKHSDILSIDTSQRQTHSSVRQFLSFTLSVIQNGRDLQTIFSDEFSWMENLFDMIVISSICNWLATSHFLWTGVYTLKTIPSEWMPFNTFKNSFLHSKTRLNTFVLCDNISFIVKKLPDYLYWNSWCWISRLRRCTPDLTCLAQATL